MRTLYLCIAAVALTLGLTTSCTSSQNGDDVTIDIFHTTDLHGNVFPYDFIADKEGLGSYSRVATYIKAHRQNHPNTTILLDAGDILQGQPSAYYYNYIDTLSKHLISTSLNKLEYDAVTIGNHDIETGHNVYDRFHTELAAPLLGANVLDVAKSEASGKPVSYFTPYTMLQREGKKIAILGLTTPAVPKFLPEELWKGMEFEDMVSCAKRLIPEIQEQKPDFIIALVHCGIGERTDSVPSLSEDAGYALASQVKGINLVLLGHDHRQYIDSIQHPWGSTTYIINPGNNGHKMSHTQITFTTEDSGNPIVVATAQLIDLDQYVPDATFVQELSQQYSAVRKFVANPVGETTTTISSRPAFLRPAPFIDLIHEVQYSVYPEAQISLVSPLALNTQIPAGTIAMRDLFKLYKYENTLYLMQLKGSEITAMLEEVADNWIRTMRSKDDPLLRLAESKGQQGQHSFERPFFNFDTAAGIRYKIDVTKEHGKRITVLGMINGGSFEKDRMYRVVVNSYRGNGGGDLLTQAAGLTPDELRARLLSSSDHDLRYYLMQYLQDHNPYTPRTITQWSFEPKEWIQSALQRDSIILFKGREE